MLSIAVFSVGVIAPSLNPSHAVAHEEAHAEEDADGDTDQDGDINLITVTGRMFDDVVQPRTLVINAPSGDLVNVLSSVPGIKLFRRADNRTAHPTTKGLSMRGIGANAAGRVLVTLDGIPLNDPFGGWVYWSQLNSKNLADIRLNTGGAAAGYGHLALAGQVRLNSRMLDGTTAEMGFGSQNQKEMHVTGGNGKSISFTAGWRDSDGDYLLAKQQRGLVDIPTKNDSLYATLALGHQFDSGAAGVTYRYLKENRVNGTSTSTNQTRLHDIALHATRRFDPFTIDVSHWYKARDFANSFTSVRDAERSIERIALDQYDVPAWAVGGSLRLTQRAGNGSRWLLGTDYQRSSGETNELFRNLGAGFTRERQAGGDQFIMGLYGQYSLNHSNSYRLLATLRLDHYRVYNGRRYEFNLADSSAVRDESYETISGDMLSGGLSGDIDVIGSLSWTFGASKSWRLPTLNEYYRPFRVGNDITEANGELQAEKLYTLETGLTYQPSDMFAASLNVYRAYLKDGVGNITIGFGPGFYALGGFVPAGGVLRQRANVDEAITDGLELSTLLTLGAGSIGFDYLYADARITDFADNPDLIGKRPVQTPRHSFTLSGTYKIHQADVALELRYLGAMVDDDLNERKLEDAAVVNMTIGYDLGDDIRLTLQATNLLDAKVVSALSSTGLETLAQRRSLLFSVTYSF